MIADSQTGAALMEYICQHPGEDDVRLAYADWLEEHGDEARAEFIRVGCEAVRVLHALEGEEKAGRDTSTHVWEKCLCYVCGWRRRWETLCRRERELLDEHGWLWLPRIDGEESGTCDTMRVNGHDIGLAWRRGFVASVSLPLASLVGGECGRCVRGRVTTERGEGFTCTALLRSAPVEAIKISDRTNAGQAIGGEWYWEEDGYNPATHNHWVLPAPLWKSLEGYSRESCRTQIAPSRQRFYGTNPAAQDALAAAALLYARRLAWPCGRCESRTWVADALGRCRCPNCHGAGHTVIAD